MAHKNVAEKYPTAKPRRLERAIKRTQPSQQVTVQDQETTPEYRRESHAY